LQVLHRSINNTKVLCAAIKAGAIETLLQVMSRPNDTGHLAADILCMIPGKNADADATLVKAIEIVVEMCSHEKHGWWAQTLIKQLAAKKTSLDALLSSSAIELLLRAVESGKREGIDNACGALRDLMSKPACLNAIISVGAVTRLVKIIGDIHINSSAMYLLLREIMQSKPGFEAAISTGTITMLIDAVKSTNAQSSQEAMVILSIVAKQKVGLDEMVSSGVIPAVLDVIQTGDSSRFYSASQILSVIAKEEAGVDEMVLHKIIKSAVETLRYGEVESFDPVINVLQSYASQKGGADAIVSAGGIGELENITKSENHCKGKAQLLIHSIARSMAPKDAD
jgi:hypothetical protein